MSKNVETLRVKDVTDSVKELTGVIKDSYLNGTELFFSLWEENLKSLNSQTDLWLNLEKDYLNSARELYAKSPTERLPFWKENSKAINDEAGRFIDFQKNYLDSIKTLGNKSAKDIFNLTQKKIEKTFALFDDYLNSLSA